MSLMSNKPMFTKQELLLIDAAAALKLAQETAAYRRYETPDTRELQKRLMEHVHKMRRERLEVLT